MSTKHHPVTKGTQAAEDRLAEINERMNSWTSFIRDLPVPSELQPAVMTGRFELVNLAQVRPLSADECRAMFDLVKGLLETNQVLREHAQLVATGVQTIVGNLKGSINVADRMVRLANFQEPSEELEGVET